MAGSMRTFVAERGTEGGTEGGTDGSKFKGPKCWSKKGVVFVG